MHKSFYASGFLYHSPSQQILLQKLTDDVAPILFRGTSRNGNSPQEVFQQCVEHALGVSIPTKSIHPVYDYVHDRLGMQYIFYVEVTDRVPKTYSQKNKAEWFALSKLSKQTISEQTRHDIIVGERVIRFVSDTSQRSQHEKRSG